MNLLGEIREAARSCARAQGKERKQLLTLADELACAIHDFGLDPEDDNLREINCLYARALRIMRAVENPGPTGGQGGAKRGGAVFAEKELKVA